MTDLLDLARKLLPVAHAAGEIEMKYFKADVKVIKKSDGSPVTKADREAEALIEKELASLTPDIPMVGEEAAEEGRIPDVSGGTFYLVDALDGTRAFIRGDADFTVNIALLQNFKPVMGIIYAPASGAIYYGAAGTAFTNDDTPIHARPAPPAGLSVITGHRNDASRVSQFLSGRAVCETKFRSSSIKFCVIASGGADIYPRLGPTSEWDTAAGEAILSAAGGSVTDTDGKPLVYGKTEQRFLNPAFVANGAVVSS